MLALRTRDAAGRQNRGKYGRANSKGTPRTPETERGSCLRAAGVRGRGCVGARGLEREGGRGRVGAGARVRERRLAHHDRVVLAQGEALGHVFGVLARDIEEARACAAQQLDEDRLDLPLGHVPLRPRVPT